LRAPGDLEALVAADQGDDQSKHRRLADADQVGGQANRLAEPLQEGGEAHVELGSRHHHAAQDAHRVGVDGEQRQRDGERKRLRQHEQVERPDADRA